MDSAENATNRSDDVWGSSAWYSSLVLAMGISFWGGGAGNQRPRGKTARHSEPKDF